MATLARRSVVVAHGVERIVRSLLLVPKGRLQQTQTSGWLNRLARLLHLARRVNLRLATLVLHQPCQQQPSPNQTVVAQRRSVVVAVGVSLRGAATKAHYVTLLN
jgi:hypothetical protein